MCVNISATDGLPAIALASIPPSGRARRRFTKMVLFRSQESSRASSKGWSGKSDIGTLRFLIRAPRQNLHPAISFCDNDDPASEGADSHSMLFMLWDFGDSRYREAHGTKTVPRLRAYI